MVLKMISMNIYIFVVVFFLIIHCAYFPANYQAVWKICINRNRLKPKQLPSRKNRVRLARNFALS